MAAILVFFAFFFAAEGARLITYINKITAWWPPEAIAGAIGVPGYAPKSAYTTINLAFWTSNNGPVDAALLWANAYEYVSADNPWGNNTQQVQAAWLKAYHDQGIKVLVSAFGDTDFPTSEGKDPNQVAQDLANFVKVNQLDGADLDWEDNSAMDAGTGEQWVITCSNKLRSLLGSGYIISHAPQAPYFMGAPNYKNGGYLTVDKQAGSGIDYYNIQFYNQATTTYSTYADLFQTSDGWSNGTAVYQIAKSVNVAKLIVGKPVTTGDATNTGYVTENNLSQYFTQAQQQGSWKAGVFGWQYYSDIQLTGNTWINSLAKVF